MEPHQQRCLLLTPWYFPHKIIRWTDAICLLYLGKAESVVDYPVEIRSPSTSIRAPAVVRLRKPLRNMKRGVKFSRVNVYARDDFTCQYCGSRRTFRELSYDHVFPRSRGGRTEWNNIVTACKSCNATKANRTCDESGMFPRRRPVQPKALPITVPQIELVTAPPEWEPWLGHARARARALG
jgi:5-methylcytosine-specific restriction endonuclease McrA